jgi:hypothetical protein
VTAPLGDHQGCRLRWRLLAMVFACFCTGQVSLQAQDFKLFDRDVQIHGFASQGFVYTNDNNWLTMNTSQGSAAFTDFGVNVSTNVTDRLRVGAQLYDRNLGQLGQYHPSLDWAVVDYRFKVGSVFAAAKSKPRWACTPIRKTWISFTPLHCFRKAFIRRFAMPPLLTWAVISTATLPFSTNSAIYPIRSMLGIAVTASIAATFI